MMMAALVLPDTRSGMSRGIDHPQPLQAANPQSLIDHGERIGSHSAGRSRVIDGAAALPAVVQELLIGLDLDTGIELIDDIRTERGRLQDFSQHLQAFDVGGAIDLGREVIDANLRRRGGIGAPDTK